MSADSEHWLELKQFEHCEPSALAFRALVALLDTWSGDDRAAAIEYADDLLSSWPEADRLAPWSWCKAASKGVVLPTWPLVRRLQLSSGHLSKGKVNLARLAHSANLAHITELELPAYSDFQELSFLYHRPETFPALKKLRAVDKYDDGDVRALAGSPLWKTLESFEVEDLTDSLFHSKDASRIVPQFDDPGRVRHLTLRAADLMALWDTNNLPNLQSASVFILSVGEAQALAARAELKQLKSLSLAFRCGFSGSSPFEPFLGNVIEPDETAADEFFGEANLGQLEKLSIFGYSMGYWGREGLGSYGLETLIASGLLQRLKHLHLKLLPIGDEGVAALAPALGNQLETLELVDVYCKSEGAAALVDSPCLPSLRTLDLSANRIGSEQIVRLANIDMPNLQSLDLSGPTVNPYYWHVGQQPVLDAGAAAWAESTNAEHLKRLRLSNCFLSDDALRAIFQSTKFRTLTELDLSNNLFTAKTISQAAIESPLWQTLEKIDLSDCRLGNAEIEALTRVPEAPALRMIELAYNSIGPSGAAALANWPVLKRVWQLGLHDNVVGDEGLIALAESAYLGRLLELDLEQDCWNSRTFDFNDRAAAVLAGAQSLSRLDGMFSGCVDEYHGAAYSPGFSKTGLDMVRRSEEMRPAFRTCCSDFSGIDEYFESSEFDEDKELGESDFRGHPYSLIDREAEATERSRMQQVGYPGGKESEKDADPEPPKISEFVPIEDADEIDSIEGIEFRDPTPVTDLSDDLDLSLEDDERPLPQQAGKFLSDTLGSIFRATVLGSFETGGSTSRQGDDGRDIPTDYGFYVRIKGDPQPALQLMREALWWIRAPAGTDLRELELNLSAAPARLTSRFLQLANLTVTRWGKSSEPGHRIDRVPFSPEQRTKIRLLLEEFEPVEADDGWLQLETDDGGRLSVFARYLDESDEFAALNILVEELKPGVSKLVDRFMQDCGLMLLPMAFAATEEVAQTVDCDWPEVELISSAEKLHAILERGPYSWWTRR